MISVGTLVTPIIDSDIGTAKDRWQGIVQSIYNGKAWVASCRWYDVNGDSHDYPNHQIRVDCLRAIGSIAYSVG